MRWSQKNHANRCDGLGKGDEDQRDGCSETRADERDGFVQNSRRRTCKYQEKAGKTKNSGRNNSFFALTQGG